MIVVPITKGMEIFMSIQVRLIYRMNFDYNENGGKKSFLCKSKASISCIQWAEHDCSANNKKNGDYYERPSLSHFMDELWLWGKWWKEKLFFQIQSISIMYHNVKNMVVVPIRKRLGIIMSIQVHLISQMNFECEENDRKKSFSCKSKASTSFIPMLRTWLLCQ